LRDDAEALSSKCSEDWPASFSWSYLEYLQTYIYPKLKGRANWLEQQFVRVHESRDNWRLATIASWATTLGFIVSMFVF